MTDRADITPDLTVAKLLDAYPELFDTLVGIAPAFAKLRNPMLRKTVAKVTTLRQAAVVGGVRVGEIVQALRDAAGLETAWTGDDTGADTSAESAGPRPDWVDRATRVETFDARPLIESGDMPMARIMAAVSQLEPGQSYVFVAPFTPAPLLDRLHRSGNRVWTERVGADEYHTHCTPAHLARTNDRS